MPEARWVLILHGGAKRISEAKQPANRRALLAAADAGAGVLTLGGTAVEAVEATVRSMEDDPIFNAGYGSVLNSDGQVEMDAALMDGSTLALGGVAAVQGVRNPISVARRMLQARPTLLAGHGARLFADAVGAELASPKTMISPEALASENDRASDTVGCVALDLRGDIAAGTSTGGLSGKHPGRIGDSPLPGCGLYADNTRGGCSLSGEGEAISRTLLGAEVMHALESMGAQRAAEAALARLARVGGEAGVIVIDWKGTIGCAHNSDHFAVAVATSDRAPQAFLHMDEVSDYG